MNKRILENFGVKTRGIYRGGLFPNLTRDIRDTVKDNGMLAIIGDIGSGKTTLVNEALSGMSLNTDKAPKIIYTRNFYKEHMTIASILNAVIMDVSDEAPRRDLEARSRQFIRIVGQQAVNEKRNICIVIEEAHRIHNNTLRALKELREAFYAGISPLFSILLIGHPLLKVKLSERKEVFWRCDKMELTVENGWMNNNERMAYIRAVYGQAINDIAARRISLIKRTPLEMDYFIGIKMQEAYKAGKTILDEEAVEASLNEMKESLNVSLSQIAGEAGKGKTTVHEVLTGANTNGENVSAVKKALERLAERQEKEEQISLAS
jgi:type II secretory pathway predicted ATPase ExeA